MLLLMDAQGSQSWRAEILREDANPLKLYHWSVAQIIYVEIFSFWPMYNLLTTYYGLLRISFVVNSTRDSSYLH
jgi:hypothetical protein